MVSGSAHPSAHAEVSPIRFVMRHYLSSHLLWTAQHLSALAGTIEDAHSGASRHDPEHRSYVLSSIIAAAAFAEATINEIYQDAHDGHGRSKDGYLAPLTQRTVDALAATWEGTSEGVRLGALEKWQLLHVHADREPLDRGAQPYADAKLVLQLRNALVHYKPENASPDWEARLQTRLQGKFADNRLMAGAGNPWWPVHCIGHGCTEWAVKSMVTFTNRVAGDLGLRLNYIRIAEREGFDRAPGPRVVLPPQ